MRWIALDITWGSSAWLSVLSAECRLTWVELLCYVKGSGTEGRVRAMPAARFARMIYVGEESVIQLFKAAETHGALRLEDGHWVITKWNEYQHGITSTERVRRFREKQKGNVSETLRNVTRVSETLDRDRDRDSDKDKDSIPPKSPKRGKASASLPPIPEDLLPIRTALENFIEHRKEIKKPLTARALELVFEKARKWGFARTLQSIEDSIQGGYQGLFEPRRVSDITQPQLTREQRRRLTS